MNTQLGWPCNCYSYIVHKLVLIGMCSMTVIRLSLFLSLQCYLILAKSESILIIALPKSDNEVSASWERGEEILPGALAAIEEAKNDLLSLNLTIIEADGGPITRYGLRYSGNVLEIIANLTWQKRVSDIIGVAGVLHPSTLAVLNKFQLPTASLVHFKKTPLNNSICYMTASISTLTDSILEFLKEIRPKKIGIITETKQPYLMVSNDFITKATIPLYHEVINNHHTSPSDIVEGVLASNAHVILLSVGPSTALPMLCEAYKRGLTWPKYAWILHSYRLDDLLRSFKSNERCSNQKILEGVFIFQLTKEGSSFDSETTYHNFSNDGCNPYAYLLHDSVWALISSADTRSVSRFNEALSPFHFKSDKLAKVYVYHNLNSMASLIGTYNGTPHTLTTNISDEIVFTDYDLPVVNREAFLVPYLLPLPILSFIFNTILLILFIVFRNEPSIKSTSVSLSMLIFIGCYILVGYSACLIIIEPVFCMTLIWLSGVGVSLPLILATILVKMLRVYHIFTVHKILKQSAHLSDCALFVYTMFIISPNVILLLLWTAIDRPHRINSFIEHPGFIEIKITCQRSSYGDVWFAPAFVYLFLLSAVVITVAIKSRKIRLARFKDTKKVNLLIFLLFIVGICMFSYWRVLWHSGFVIPSLIILYTGHMLMAFICQIILFVPKIWLAIQKKATRNDDCVCTGHNIII